MTERNIKMKKRLEIADWYKPDDLEWYIGYLMQRDGWERWEWVPKEESYVNELAEACKREDGTYELYGRTVTQKRCRGLFRSIKDVMFYRGE